MSLRRLRKGDGSAMKNTTTLVVTGTNCIEQCIGITWLQQTEHAAFSPRNNFQLVSFDNKLVVIGGATKDGLNNEVWSSGDGIEWRKGFSGTFQFPQ